MLKKKKDESISKSILIMNIKPKSKHFVFTVNARIAISLFVFKFYLLIFLNCAHFIWNKYAMLAYQMISYLIGISS